MQNGNAHFAYGFGFWSYIVNLNFWNFLCWKKKTNNIFLHTKRNEDLLQQYHKKPLLTGLRLRSQDALEGFEGSTQITWQAAATLGKDLPENKVGSQPVCLSPPLSKIEPCETFEFQ